MRSICGKNKPATPQILVVRRLPENTSNNNNNDVVQESPVPNALLTPYYNITASGAYYALSLCTRTDNDNNNNIFYEPFFVCLKFHNTWTFPRDRSGNIKCIQYIIATARSHIVRQYDMDYKVYI